MRTNMVSVVIPSRSEPYLHKTILDVLEKATENIEIIAVLDGWWPTPDLIVTDPKVSYIHFSQAQGMRNAINSAVSVAQGKYILKIDAHVMFEKGFDKVLKQDCKENQVIVPRRKRLNPEKWEVIEDGRLPIDYEYLDHTDLHGIKWDEKTRINWLTPIDDIISAQGSCYFMHKDYFNYLELLDEKNYGSFFLEFQEISFKAWLSGGKVKVNKNTWYAHWHKTEGRGYSLDKNEREKAVKFLQLWKNKKAFSKQIHPFSFIKEKFNDMPGWKNM